MVLQRSYQGIRAMVMVLGAVFVVGWQLRGACWLVLMTPGLNVGIDGLVKVKSSSAS